MDPTATLLALRFALHDTNFARAVELLAAYYQWRIKGGFEPLNGDARAANMAGHLQDKLEAM